MESRPLIPEPVPATGFWAGPIPGWTLAFVFAAIASALYLRTGRDAEADARYIEATQRLAAEQSRLEECRSRLKRAESLFEQGKAAIVARAAKTPGKEGDDILRRGLTSNAMDELDEDVRDAKKALAAQEAAVAKTKAEIELYRPR